MTYLQVLFSRCYDGSMLEQLVEAFRKVVDVEVVERHTLIVIVLKLKARAVYDKQRKYSVDFHSDTSATHKHNKLIT